MELQFDFSIAGCCPACGCSVPAQVSLVSAHVQDEFCNMAFMAYNLTGYLFPSSSVGSKTLTA
jgi:hypothetical protein